MTAPREYHVIGAGGHAKVVIRLIHALGHQVVAVIDDDIAKHGSHVSGVPVVGGCDELGDLQKRPTIIAIGDNLIRQRIAEKLDLEWATVIHPSAIIDASVIMGPGSVVMAGCVVQVDTQIGRHCVVNTGATIDHDCELGDFAHIAPGANVAGHCAIGEGTLLGIGAVMIPSTRLGRWSIVGAGAAVTSDIPDQSLALGVPAKVAR
jgi:sugar O-acyltransferase (sialic acid O-acetyltransferase NeuD family)